MIYTSYISVGARIFFFSDGNGFVLFVIMVLIK